MPRLIFQTDQGRQSLELEARNGLGRHPSNTIQLLDLVVSKEHCVIELRGADMVLRDLGSRNGTFVATEQVVGERALRHGDDIRIGDTVMLYDDGAPQFDLRAPPVSAGAIHHTGAGGLAPIAGAAAGPQWAVAHRLRRPG